MLGDNLECFNEALYNVFTNEVAVHVIVLGSLMEDRVRSYIKGNSAVIKLEKVNLKIMKEVF